MVEKGRREVQGSWGWIVLYCIFGAIKMTKTPLGNLAREIPLMVHQGAPEAHTQGAELEG